VYNGISLANLLFSFEKIEKSFSYESITSQLDGWDAGLA
jgi:hypothetical protein